MTKKILWAIVLVAFIITIPSLIERGNVEGNNNTYEVVVPFTHIYDMGVHLGNYQEVLDELKISGLKTISIEPLTLNDLATQGYLLEVDRDYLLVMYKDEQDKLPDVPGTYFNIRQAHSLLPRIEEVFNLEMELVARELEINDESLRKVETISMGGDEFLFIPYRTGNIKDISLGYDFELIELLNNKGFSLMPRVPNKYIFDSSLQDHFLVEELTVLRQYGDKLLFQGADVPGFPSPNYISELALLLKELDYKVVTIEFNPQRGMDTLLSKQGLKEDVVRLHSITAGKGNEAKDVYVNQAVRALNERNIKIIMFNPLNKNVWPPQTYFNMTEAFLALKGTSSFIHEVEHHPRNEFTLGQAVPFQQLSQPLWLKLIVFVGGLAFTALFALHFSNKLVLPAVIGLGLLMVGQLVTGHQLLLKAIVLFIALVGPIFAVLSSKDRPLSSFLQIVVQFIISALIASVSAWFVISILYGTEFLLKLNEFTGVKVLSIFPAIVIVILSSLKLVKQLISKPVLYWHGAIMVVLAAVVFFYIGRTGNQGIALDIELVFRQWLEDTLLARPRTTEFLIGFPLFIVSLYATMKKKSWAPIFYVFGAIGFSSMVGTFTHLHTPLSVSLLRTFYSLSLGLIIGIVLVFVLYTIENKLYPKVKARIFS